VGNLSNQANYFWNSAFTSTYTSTFSSATSPLILDSQAYYFCWKYLLEFVYLWKL